MPIGGKKKRAKRHFTKTPIIDFWKGRKNRVYRKGKKAHMFVG